MHKRQILRIYLPTLVGIAFIILVVLFYTSSRAEFQKQEAEIKVLNEKIQKTRTFFYKRLHKIRKENIEH